MLSSDPRQAIIEHLSAPRGDLISQSLPTPGGWRSSIHRPGGEDADPDSISFVKERGVPGRHLHFVRFKTRAGELRRFVVGVVQQPDGHWQVRGCAGGGGGDPPRDRPWINFGAWGWPRFFYGGGSVIGTESERAALARLRFADGTSLEDSVDAGGVLFMTEAPVRLPVTVEILYGTGSVLERYKAFEHV
jgi:hypothetical protein